MRAIEFHGHGEQPAWRGNAPMTLADEAALAIPALEEAGGAHVIGHSYGGAVALKLATMRPRLGAQRRRVRAGAVPLGTR